jgi:TPP-dependent pyruvate/acetoin dehydrogenase alpha subunit
MGPDDVACPLIRDMGVHLVRGVTPAELMRHYLGRAGAPMEGRDGNIHLGAFDRGTIPMISHLPEMLPVGMGVALARRRRGLAAAAVGFCGDGASSGGVFHETLNLAAVWSAPLVVVLERNRYAYMTPESRYLPVERLAPRAAGYGIASATVDGNDVEEVHAAVGEALDRAREGGGPTLVEAFTYRIHGHGAHDAQRYVPPEELEEWGARDPLLRWRRRAEDALGWSDDDQDELDARIAREVEDALRDALGAPFPDAARLGATVFA